ncbi:MAG: signal peptidase II [Desulfuromonas sp.]|nr:MAG: signal peptidase II [Desulfuromonas sp.]
MAVKYRILLAVTIVSLVLDQWTKWLVDQKMALHESIPLIDNFLALTYVRNKGAAFGIFADSSFRIPFFITVSIAAVIGIIWFYRKVAEEQRLLQWALALVFCGAVGNLIDRIRFGEVIDFIDVHWYQHHWPAFNVADSCISVGVALMLVDLLRDEWQKKKGKEAGSEA